MEGKPERGRAFGPAEEQRRRRKMLISFRPRPHRRERNHVGEIEGGNRRLLHQKSEEHTSELQSLMRISYAVFCLKKKTSSTAIPTPTKRSYRINIYLPY